MENMTFSITGLSPDGRGIAERIQGEPITFVAGALPGEQVSARIPVSYTHLTLPTT